MKRTIRLAIPAMLLLAAVLLGGPAATAAQAHPSTFPDVAETHPAHEAIESLVAKDIVSGTLSGTFLPDDPVSRGQAAKIITNWRGVEPSSAAPNFSDVDPAAAPFVEAALENGWMSGFPDGSFRPFAPLSRQQMAVIVVRSLGWEEEALQLTDGQIDQILDPFYDQGAISPAARPHVALAVMRGLLTGDGDRLHPVTNVTRTQFCLVVHRAEVGGQGSAALPEAQGTASQATEDVGTGADVGADASADTLTLVEKAQADFMDAYLFRPRNSPVTGEMVVQNARWYGIPALSQLVIMAAETSLGDPKLGGAPARSYNFGCLRYHGAGTPWGLLSNGKIWAAGKDWYSFASPQIGMAAFGRYLKAGADGFYAPILSSADPDWERFAAVYYGRGVSGFSSYVSRLHTLENRFRSMAAEQGVSL